MWTPFGEKRSAASRKQYGGKSKDVSNSRTLAISRIVGYTDHDFKCLTAESASFSSGIAS